MSVQIVTRHMRPSASLRQGVAELCEAVIQCRPNVLSLRVVLDTTNCPGREGGDKRCHLMVRGRDHLCLDIEEYQDDVWQAVDAAFRRLSSRLALCKRRDSGTQTRGANSRMRIRDYVFRDQGLYAGTQANSGLYYVEGEIDE